MRRLLLWGAFFCLTTAGFSQAANYKIYLQTEPEIKGEVAMPTAWKDAWQILSFSHGISNPSTVSQGGLNSGQPEFADFATAKFLDRASVLELLRVCQGSPLDSVTISYVDTTIGNKGDAIVYQVKLEEVAITAITNSGVEGGDRPTESVQFAFGKITWKYFPTPGAIPAPTPVQASWDLRQQSQ